MGLQVVHVYFTRSDGRVFRFDDSPMGITSLEGVDAPKVEIFTEKNAVGDGDVVTGKRIASRAIEIKASSRLLELNQQTRKIASAFFNPAYTFDVQIIYGSMSRTGRNCELKALAMPTGNLYRRFEITLTMFAPNGYLEGDGIYGKDINAIAPRLGWPFVSVAGRGFLYSKFNFSKTINVNNDGDAPTFIRAVFSVVGDDVVENPKLFKDDAYVRILTNIQRGDKLEIDTEKRLVRLNGENILHLVDKTSSWTGMRMETGANTFGFDADSHDNQLSVRIYYSKRYYGMG